MDRWLRASAAIAVSVVALQCGGSPTSPSGVPLPDGLPPAPPVVLPAPTGPQVFVGAGDIAMCDANSEATARLLDTIGGTVFTLGDHAYFRGTRAEFSRCYDPTWGRHRARTRPTPGNHDYETPGAAPYFEYFGANAGPAGLGYYSFDVGAWHVVSLNSNVAADAGSAQAAWLQSDLSASRARCTLAFWHHPLFSGGPSGASPQLRHVWRLLYETGAELVLNGHEHYYQRFAPQDPDGRVDPTRGIRQFIVGTGGAVLYPLPGGMNSEAAASQFGVLRLTLQPDVYQWQFVPVSGVGDSGIGTCH
jgi:hypothetical protein